MATAEPDRSPLPILRRARRPGITAASFHGQGWGVWTAAGITLLVASILIPLLRPEWAGLTERIATLAALMFLLAAPGLVMGMGTRAVWIAGIVVLFLYALSVGGGFALRLEDLFLVAVLVSFGLFLLAGLNLVLVLEEMVYDIHRVLLHPRQRSWLALPFLLFAALSLGLPFWEARGGPSLPFLYGSAVACTILVGAWWLVRAARNIRGSDEIVREIHLLCFSLLAAGALTEGIRPLQEAETLVPSVVAYLILIGTWIYVNYTTLQRAHFLLKARDAGPWIAILLAASFAIVAHAQVLYRTAGTEAVQDLTGQRISFMIFGVGAGVLFLVARGLWRGFEAMTNEARLSAASRRRAAQASKVASSILATEHKVEEATLLVFKAIDRIIPGSSQPPQRQPKPWELDGEGIGPRP
ncbi:MAG: hypothetical protein AABX89_01165 [Candidatus Thermoplasmatota archaeon]